MAKDTPIKNREFIFSTPMGEKKIFLLSSKIIGLPLPFNTNCVKDLNDTVSLHSFLKIAAS